MTTVAEGHHNSCYWPLSTSAHTDWRDSALHLLRTSFKPFLEMFQVSIPLEKNLSLLLTNPINPMLKAQTNYNSIQTSSSMSHVLTVIKENSRHQPVCQVPLLLDVDNDDAESSHQPKGLDPQEPKQQPEKDYDYWLYYLVPKIHLAEANSSQTLVEHSKQSPHPLTVI